MASTTKFGIDYPAEGDNPFWTTYLSGMNEIDDLFAAVLEEASLVIVGGGVITRNQPRGEAGLTKGPDNLRNAGSNSQMN